MSWWELLAFLFFVWIVWVIAAMLKVEIENVRKPVAGGRKRGMSPTPAIPLFPLAFWGFATLVDQRWSPWGWITIVALHALFGVVLLSSIFRSAWQLRVLVAAKRVGLKNDQV